jgi:hypothetical protein
LNLSLTPSGEALNLSCNICFARPSKASLPTLCMKYFRLALVVFASALGLVRAQDDQASRQPPTEIPDFSNLDEYTYEPRSTLIFGLRRLSGAKTQFYGKGTLAAPELATDATTSNLLRNYHDGSVSPDARVAGRIDANGNPVVDSSGSQVFDPIASDGKTNTWTYSDARQVTADGYLAFHTYSAVINDPTVRNKQANTANGVDVTMSRDMGKLFGSRASWSLIAGVTISDLAASRSDKVQATLTALTDLYSLDGQVLPAPVYSAPSSSTTTVTDSLGNAVLNSDGSTQTASTDTTVLLNNKPVDRQTKTATDSASVSNRWKLKGAYLTFRAGPAVWVPFTTRLRAMVSAGPAIIYSGSKYTVSQAFQPEIGAEISDTSSSEQNKFLPGYFADASLQFDLTEHAGFFAGAVFQSAGSYTQTVTSTAANYATKIDFANQNGLRAGMTIRF